MAARSSRVAANDPSWGGRPARRYVTSRATVTLAFRRKEVAAADILAVYLSLGFISTAHLHEGYQHACQMGHKNEFLSALKSRHTKALDYLRQMVAGRLLRESLVIPRLPMQTDGGTDGASRI